MNPDDPWAEIAAFDASPLAAVGRLAPWDLTARAAGIVEAILAALPPGYLIEDGVAVHASASVEAGAVLKGPLIVGPACRIAAGAYLRGGCWLAEDCVVGPGAEVKSSFLFAAARLAHFNFVGDSILGGDVNLEAGAIIANHRNERADPTIAIRVGGRVVETGVTKFGALVGDGARIGANAVVAPGALLARGTVVPRLGLVDQA
ncbi:LpxA family transferase [Salinarimonas soli]|uniref:LpxA family transferase n=1 Tax=Salinarimonas soli TaxID=1638099 RepID=A0A5B2UZF2_9HYPH|nr:LpxA family transferase [Salinarimonas soli]KAA2232146.1 LpxA family transferase [Salinarimonas soli]